MSGELVLVCGDMHVPSRAGALPDAFRSILAPGKVAHVLCTGNAAGPGSAGETLDYLRSLAPRCHVVRGDFDEDGSSHSIGVV
jgi:vacuolar protein sorting-associated protein 29